MTKLAYLDCPTGIAGDMCLGALVDAGVPLEYLTTHLKRLGISDEYHLRTETVLRQGQRATKVWVEIHSPAVASHPHADHSHGDHSHGDHSHGDHSHGDRPHTGPAPQHDPAYPQGTRHLPEIEQMILAATLPQRAESWSLAVFRQLAAAEAAVHGIAVDQVHFHEVGATDAIVDIVGTCLGLDWLEIDHLYCSPLPMGGGTVRAAHGRLPVPVPAVLQLWQMRQVPIYDNGLQRELVTPTGAAIATTLATAFTPPPALILQQVGLGAGTLDLPIPNILRLWIGEAIAPTISNAASTHIHPPIHPPIHPSTHPPIHPPTAPPEETITLLETHLDDLTPQAIGYLFDTLLAAGALDVFTQAIGMKKSRPGVLITVICRPEKVATCRDILFRETTTLGIRQRCQTRTALHREFQQAQTPYGPVQIKVARYHPNAVPVNVHPEYEDCARLAREQQVPWQRVHQAALQAWYGQSL
ncbi:MAG: nickel pincer cofactor biosynthesis protein LarC [Synechococcales bacterium]|nr:nickel pincer cofactor biosynthesis protein LarC [Synechococcales bacterium]